MGSLGVDTKETGKSAREIAEDLSSRQQRVAADTGIRTGTCALMEHG